jgi:hypothetical protein
MGRLFGGLGVLLLVGALLWWGVFYGALADESGVALGHAYVDHANCLIYAYDGCIVPGDQFPTALGFTWPVYQPIAIWVAAALIFLGILMPRERRR